MSRRAQIVAWTNSRERSSAGIREGTWQQARHKSCVSPAPSLPVLRKSGDCSRAAPGTNSVSFLYGACFNPSEESPIVRPAEGAPPGLGEAGAALRTAGLADRRDVRFPRGEGARLASEGMAFPTGWRSPTACRTRPSPSRFYVLNPALQRAFHFWTDSRARTASLSRLLCEGSRARGPASGRTYPDGLATAVSIPALHYPLGSNVAVTGARVASRPCAALLLLRTRPHADRVSLEVTPSSTARSSPRDLEAAADHPES